VPWTKFGENSNSQFFNLAARRINTKGGKPLSANGSCAFEGGIYDGSNGFVDWLSLGLVDPLGYDFRPNETSPLRGAGVVHPPYTPHYTTPPTPTPTTNKGKGGGTEDATDKTEAGEDTMDASALSSPDIGAYAYGAEGEAAWRPGCTFHPTC
jgi:hypothetical protein